MLGPVSPMIFPSAAASRPSTGSSRGRSGMNRTRGSGQSATGGPKGEQEEGARPSLRVVGDRQRQSYSPGFGVAAVTGGHHGSPALRQSEVEELVGDRTREETTPAGRCRRRGVTEMRSPGVVDAPDRAVTMSRSAPSIPRPTRARRLALGPPSSVGEAPWSRALGTSECSWCKQHEPSRRFGRPLANPTTRWGTTTAAASGNGTANAVSPASGDLRRGLMGTARGGSPRPTRALVGSVSQRFLRSSLRSFLLVYGGSS